LNLPAILGAILLALPLPGIEKQTQTLSWFSSFVTDSLYLNPQGAETTFGGVSRVFVKPENLCAIPFAKPFCLVTRYTKEVSTDGKGFIGPVTGHLALNRVFVVSMKFEGAPVSRNSAVALIAMASPKSKGVLAWAVRMGSELKDPSVEPVPMPCKGMYGVSLLYSGRDPALGRVWHREIIGLEGGVARVSWTTGGFVMGPVGTFSAGPGYYWSAPPDGTVITFLRLQGCSLTVTRLLFSDKGSVEGIVRTTNLEKETVFTHKFTIKVPWEAKFPAPSGLSVALGWAAQWIRVSRPLMPSLAWLVLRTTVAGWLGWSSELPWNAGVFQQLWFWMGR
jgi:hypothetical protein